MNSLPAASVLLCFSAAVVAFSRSGQENDDLSPSQAEKAIRGDSTMVILDVRTSEEYSSETGHLRGAILIPVQELERRVNELKPFRERTILVYCRLGRRSKRAQEILQAHGYKGMNMTGGIAQWNDEHRPVVHEPGRE